jgi:hypothetical protein
MSDMGTVLRWRAKYNSGGQDKVHKTIIGVGVLDTFGSMYFKNKLFYTEKVLLYQIS